MYKFFIEWINYFYFTLNSFCLLFSKLVDTKYSIKISIIKLQNIKIYIIFVCICLNILQLLVYLVLIKKYKKNFKF